MRKTILIAALVLFTFAIGCKKEEQSPPLVPQNLSPGGSSIAFDSKIKSLESIVEKDPKNLSALVELGNIYMDTGKFMQAVEMYGKSLEINPNDQNVRVDMGVCYRRSGRSDLAMETIRKAIEMQPNHALAHMNMGVILFDDYKKYKEAIPEFEKYLELAPNAQNAPDIRALVEELKQQVRYQ